MRIKQIGATLYQYYLILAILAAIAISGGRHFIWQKQLVEVNVSIEDIQVIFPTATHFAKNRFDAFEAYDANGNKTGTAFLSSNYTQQYGYAGIVPVLIGVDDGLTIANVMLLPNNETGDYVEAVYSNSFLGQWRGVSLENALQYQVDAVSGATHTSNAVIAGVRHTAASVVKSDASVMTETSFWTSIKDILFLLLMALSVIMVYKKGKAKFRAIYSVLVLIIMGLILNNALSLQLMHGWLLDGFSWRANWQSSLVFILALVLSFLGKRKFYCNYLCPMGALQELTNKITPFKTRRLPTKYKGIAIREVYLMLIAGALLVGLKPGLAYLEPFMFFSFHIVGVGLIIFGIVVVILSLFYSQPWCSVCPTGCALDTIAFQRVKNIESKKV